MKKIFFILSIVVGSLQLSAQDFIGVSWDLSASLLNTYKYINHSSLRGVTFFDIRNFYGSEFSVGGSMGWHAFYKSMEGSFSDGNATITGKQFRHINSIPIMVNLHYYVDEDPEDITFYIGSGIGTYIAEQRTDMGLYSSGAGYKWHFGLQPQLGVLIPVTSKFDFHLAFKYNYAFKRSDREQIQYLTLSLGIARW